MNDASTHLDFDAELLGHLLVAVVDVDACGLMFDANDIVVPDVDTSLQDTIGGLYDKILTPSYFTEGPPVLKVPGILRVLQILESSTKESMTVR